MESRVQSAVGASHAGSDEAFARILQSAAFVKAPSLRTLLTYLWEHRDDAISEYALATEALGRPAVFDPRTDATVRVVVARLRQRLKEYYEEDGVDCPLRLTIPLGGHHLAVEFREPEPTPATEPEPEEAVVSTPAGSTGWVTVAVACATALVGIAAGYFIPRAGEARPPLPVFWTSFLNGGKPTSVYVPTPVFASWANSTIRMRDVRVNDPDRLMQSPEIASMASRLGTPQFSQSYTVGPDTFAAVKLAQYLEARGVHVEVAGTHTLSIDSSLERNVVVPGTSWSSGPVRDVTNGANFQIALENTEVILNRTPQTGEPTEYRTRKISSNRAVHYGVVVQRTTAAGTHQLALAGIHTDVLVSFLTAPASLSELEREWRKAGSPTDFEALVEAEVQGDTTLRARLVSFRSIRPNR